MSRILEQTLVAILLLLRWKRSVVFANLQATREWSGWKGKPPDPLAFYKLLIQNLAREMLLFLRGCRSEKEFIPDDSLAALENMRHGGFLLTAHIGNWEYLGSWLRRSGIPLVATYKPLRHSLANQLLQKIRHRNGNPVSRFEDQPFQLRTWIQQGKLFTFLADQDFRPAPATSLRLQHTFLGLHVSVNPLPERILDLFPSIPVYFSSALWSSERGAMILHVTDLGVISSSGSIYRTYHEWLESQIAQNPTFWAGWTHRRFYATNPLVYSRSVNSLGKSRLIRC